MGNVQEKKEWFITLGIPLVVSLVGICISALGRRYYLHVFIYGAGFIIIITSIFYIVSFLQDRERRWRVNNRKHELLEKAVADMKLEVKSIKEGIDTNSKINKLENQINYIMGVIAWQGKKGK